MPAIPALAEPTAALARDNADSRPLHILAVAIKLFRESRVFGITGFYTPILTERVIMRIARVLTTTVLLLLATIGHASAAERINTLEKQGLFSYEPSGVAIRGYDTVAYFTEGQPVEGSDEYTTDWEGATWKFSSQEHLDLFNSEPAKYAPQYGGYCAYGVAQESLVKIEPDQWTIVDDKLYLNYNAKLNNEWKKDISGYVSKADELFESLLAK